MKIILWLAIAVATGLYICGAVVDPDLWWHITVGRWIIAHHSIPSVDLWNQFGVGQPWRAYSWSNEIVAALVDQHFGDYGLLALQMLLAVAISCVLFYCLGKLSGDWFFGSLLGGFATASCFDHFTLRPQSVVWIYFALLLLLVETLVSKGFNLSRLGALLGVMCLWANTHITTALAIGIVVFWILASGIKRGLAFQILGAAFLGTILTPYLGGEWLTFFSKTGHPFDHRTIREFQPANIMMYSTAFLVISFALLCVLIARNPRTLEPAKGLLAGAFTLGALAVVKFLPMAVILNCALIAIYWERLQGNARKIGPFAEAIDKLRAAFDWLPRQGLTFLVLCFATLSIFRIWRDPINTRIVPVHEVDFIQAQKLPQPILNDFGRGGYMMYRFSDGAGNPGYLVPIDGRTNVVPPEVWEKSSKAFQGWLGWEQYLELIKPRTILWPNESPLISILLATERWCRVFRSGEEREGFSVFVSRDWYTGDAPDGLASENCSQLKRS
ncbi:MAG: hypothetical protein K1X83_06390 [Oligoflexia bacterium]|nr:hypothetical protein [Oligoflexia bacterium]